MQKILHVVEPLVAGIHTFLVELTNHQCDDFDVYITYNICYQFHNDLEIILMKTNNISWK
jgi:hypothetical protein